MRIQRGRHRAEFKAKVALIALTEQRTINEIASRYEVRPGQVSQWKKQAKDDIFIERLWRTVKYE
ncbi:MAG: transposase, partial [Chloroflexi bacterium]|nr:transposase [Chloroflexota bacterium]